MKKKMDVQDFWDKKELSESRIKLFLIIFCVCFGLYFAYYMADLYMELNNLTFLKFKINPEFAFVVNGKDEVVYYIPLNKDAKIFSFEMFDGMNVENAVNKAIDVAKENDYLIDNKKIEVSVIDEEIEKKELLEEKVVDVLRKKDKAIVSEVVEASNEEKQVFNTVTLKSLDKLDNLTKDEKIEVCEYTKVDYKNMSGINRYVSAINISKEIYPNGTKNVILIASNDLVDGYLSSSLASILDASILFVDKDGIKNEVMDEIRRLNPSNIYILGGNAVISDNVINIVDKEFNIKAERIAGSNRFESSINVAKKIDSIEPVNSIIIAPNSNDLADAAIVSNISGKMNMPILYTDANTLNNSVKEYIKSNKNISSIYVSGGLLNEKVINDLKSLGRSVEVISGSDRYKTNASIIDKFHKYFDSVVLVNNLVDVIISSHLANKTDSALFYTSDSLDVEHIKLLRNNKNIKQLYYLGGTSAKVAFKDTLFNIKKTNSSNCEHSVEEMLFMNNKVVFYVPHQDDETLYFGQTITTAIDRLGADNVHLVLFTNGESSAVYVKDGEASENKVNNQMLIDYGYVDENNNPSFSMARDAEFKAAIKELGVKNYTFVEELDFIDKRFTDKDLKNKKNLIKEVMKYYDNLYGSDVTHITYTNLDEHIDHSSLGLSLSELYFDNTLTDNQFENVYLITKSDQVYNINEKYTLVLNNTSNFDKQLNAFKKYDKDEANKIIGIGYKSVRGVFNNLENKMEEKSLQTIIHIPYKK